LRDTNNILKSYMGHCNKLLKYSLKIKRYKTFPLGEIAL